MAAVRRIVLAVAGIVLITSVAWCGFAIKSARAEVSYRAFLAHDGERSDGQIAEEGLARPDGAYAQAWVELPSGQRVFVDLSDSTMSVFRLGDTLTVVVPPEKAPRDVALPLDVVERPASETYRARLTLPAIIAALALVTFGTVYWRVRRTHSSSESAIRRSASSTF